MPRLLPQFTFTVLDVKKGRARPIAQKAQPFFSCMSMSQAAETLEVTNVPATVFYDLLASLGLVGLFG